MKTWYHVTTQYLNEENEFNPNIPYYLRKGEDKRNARICVTDNWRHSLRSIILIKRCKDLYVYSTSEAPINPIETRKKLLKDKKIRKNCNDFQLLDDGICNKEHWFLNATKMKLEGVVKIPKEDYGRMLMGFGFMGEPDIDKLQLEKYVKREMKDKYFDLYL